MSLNSDLIETASRQRVMWAEDFIDRFVKASRDEQVEVLKGVYIQVVVTLKSKEGGKFKGLDELVTQALGIYLSERLGVPASQLQGILNKALKALPQLSKFAILDLVDAMVQVGSLVREVSDET